ncbi:MAG: hypothetical protein H7Y88_02110 [Phycisphaerales bacterium]|nr:hypothetical protein [Phycisphaerales bacterium]
MSRTEASVLRALFTWADQESGECWPAIGTVAAHTKLSERAVGKALDALAGRGILTYLHKSRGGAKQTHRLRINLGTLAALAEHAREGANSERGASNPEPRAGTPNRAHENSERRSEEPSIHNPPEEPTMNSGGAEVRSAGDGWMGKQAAVETSPAMPVPSEAADNVRETLRHHGVKGPNIDRLASAPGITSGSVIAEAARLKSDPIIRSLPAALVKALATRFDVVLGQVVAPDQRAWLSGMEALKRTKQMSEPTQSLGSIIGRAGR